MGFILKTAVTAVSIAALMPQTLLAVVTDKKFIPLDMNMVRRHNYFGYTPEEIHNLFGQPLEIDFDTTGEAVDRIQPPPKPFVHPRILFNPDELPAIRARLEKTKAGKLQMDAIRVNIKKFVTGPNAVFAAEYQQLIDGDDSVDLKTVSGDSSKLNFTYNLMYEAFRCLIDNDEDGGRKVAATITTLARIDKRAIEANMAKELAKAKPGDPDSSHDFRVVAETATQEGTLGLMYDFAYNWMNQQQRSTVRDACAKASDGMTNIGCETLYGQTTNTSNWITWSARLIFPTLAIEGEPGYDPSTYARCVYAYRGIVVRGIFAGGEGYEGMGKFFTFNEHMIAMAKRGENLIAASHLSDAFHNYFVASLNPWGQADTFYDSLGGTNDHVSRNADILAYKFLYPNDKAVDYVYRNNIKPDYSNFGQPVNTRHPFLATEALVSALYAQDYDASLTNEQERKQVTASMPLTYFSDDTCNMITRSSWDDRALYLNYLNRAVRGGHQYSDRSHFSIYADGRYWGVYRHLRQVDEQYMAKNRSVVLVDGEGATTGPGKCVAFEEKPMASFIASDLKPTFDYIADGVIPAPDRHKIVMMPFTSNDFRLHPSNLAFMNLPLDAGADWYTSRKPNLWGLDGGTSPKSKNDLPPASALWHQANIPMRKAFRTAGMVRGAHPYVLIIDDIQKDDQIRDYSWGMTIADDVLLGQQGGYSADPSNSRLDIVLDEKPVVPSAKRSDDDLASTELPGDDRHLLIRILDGDNVDTNQPGTIETVTDNNGAMKTITIPKLCIHSRSADPHFKMLFVPFRSGQSLPTTSWNADKTVLNIQWPDQTDVITFSKRDDGRATFKIQRQGESIVAMQ